MDASTEFRIRHSKDQAAYQEAQRLEAEVARLPSWRPRRRAAQAQLEAARERCLQAGVDWARAPRPPRNLRAPDRSRRVRVGERDARAPRGWKPTPPTVSAAGTPLQLAGTLAIHQAAPSPRADTSRAATPSTPSTPASAPATGLTGGLGTGTGAGAGAAAAYGAADAGSFTAVAATDWLATEPSPAFSDAAGNRWLEGDDGSLWFVDQQGAAYTLAPDGNFFALSPDGMLYGQALDGSSVTWAPDGTPLTMDDQGQLWAAGAEGPLLYGDDGQLYTPDDAALAVSSMPPEPGAEGWGGIEDVLPGLGEEGFVEGDPMATGDWGASSDELVGVEDVGEDGGFTDTAELGGYDEMSIDDGFGDGGETFDEYDAGTGPEELDPFPEPEGPEPPGVDWSDPGTDV